MHEKRAKCWLPGFVRFERKGSGTGGIAILAQFLGIPRRTWDHYEKGVIIPACILLEFIELTGVDPRWLLRGEG